MDYGPHEVSVSLYYDQRFQGEDLLHDWLSLFLQS